MKQSNKRKLLVKKVEAKPKLRGDRGKLDKKAEKVFFNSKFSR